MRIGRSWRYGWLLSSLAIFIVLRAVILVAEYRVTGGTEFAMDPWNFDIGHKPLSVITFQSDMSAFSQPPLYPLAIFPLVYSSSRLFAPFLAVRVSFTLLELISFVLLALVLFRFSEMRERDKFYVMLIAAVSPLGFMTGAVMKQEEAIVAIFTCAVLLAWKTGSSRAAALLTFLGMITGKILFAVTFIPLLFDDDMRRETVYWGIMPSAVFFSIYGFMGYLKTGSIPVLGFTPDIIWFCISVYALVTRYYYISGAIMNWTSLGLIATIYLWLFASKKRIRNREFPVIYLFSYLVLLSLFYHVNPEYYIYILPLLSLVPFAYGTRKFKTRLNVLHIILGLASWGYGAAYGIRVFSQHESYSSRAKEIALAAYKAVFGAIPIEIVEITLMVLALAALFLITVSTARMMFSPTIEAGGIEPE